MVADFVTIRNDYITCDKAEFDSPDLEIAWSSIQLHDSKQLFIGFFYRPPLHVNLEMKL